MECICLAAGKGSRLAGLGAYLQKCMYPIAGKPFLELTLASLVQALPGDLASHRVTFVIGHLGEQVRGYFGSSYRGLPLTYVEQPAPRGTGHAVHTAYSALECTGPAMIWLADLFVETRLFAAMLAYPGPDVLTVCRHLCDRQHNERLDHAGGRVTRSWQGGGDDVDIGLWKLAPATMAGMTARQADECRALHNLQLQIDAGLAVGVIRADCWVHLGGTEPSVEASLIETTRYLLDREEARL